MRVPWSGRSVAPETSVCPRNVCATHGKSDSSPAAWVCADGCLRCCYLAIHRPTAPVFMINGVVQTGWTLVLAPLRCQLLHPAARFSLLSIRLPPSHSNQPTVLYSRLCSLRSAVYSKLSGAIRQRYRAGRMDARGSGNRSNRNTVGSIFIRSPS